MRLFEIPSSLLCLITIISPYTKPVGAAVLLPPEQFVTLENKTLFGRGSCAAGQIQCGYYSQLCCNSDEYCYTDANTQAQCGQNHAATPVALTTNVQLSVYTTTYVETNLQTVTATYTSSYPVTTLSCSYSLGETPCGSCCCQPGQMCQSAGQCVVVAGGSSAYYSSLYTVTTQTIIPPLKPTSGTTVTVSQTGSITTTVPYQTAISTGGAILTGGTTTSHGLSGGAIAGIVIGVIAGLILLFLLCACLCFKTLWDGLLDILGIRRSGRRRTEETYIDRRTSRRQSAGRTWFGTRPGRASRTSVDVVEKRRTSGGWGGLATVGAALGGLALVLGLKRRRDRRREEDQSSVSYDYYSSNYTSASSESSHPRTRNSRSRSRSRVSRGTRR